MTTPEHDHAPGADPAPNSATTATNAGDPSPLPPEAPEDAQDGNPGNSAPVPPDAPAVTALAVDFHEDATLAGSDFLDPDPVPVINVREAVGVVPATEASADATIEDGAQEALIDRQKRRLRQALRSGRIRRGVAFDLETIPLLSSLAIPYNIEERDVPKLTKTGKYKTQEDLDAWRAEDEAAWASERLKGFSINPRLGRIVSVGIALTDDMPETALSQLGDTRAGYLAKSEADEHELVSRLWYTMAAADRVITFNGMSFDLHYLIIRSLLLGVHIPKTIDVPKLLIKYRSAPHMDVRMLLTNWDYRQSGMLNDWAACFGFPSKSMHGSEVYQAYVEERWDDLTEYPQQDATLTLGLAQILSTIF